MNGVGGFGVQAAKPTGNTNAKQLAMTKFLRVVFPERRIVHRNIVD